MTAKHSPEELADELDANTITSFKRYTAAAMLRTIPALEAEVEALRSDIEGYITANTEMLNELEALRKAKPIAWLVQYKRTWDLTFCKPVSDDDAVVEPLYAHPAKTLTLQGMDVSAGERA